MLKGGLPGDASKTRFQEIHVEQGEDSWLLSVTQCARFRHGIITVANWLGTSRAYPGADWARRTPVSQHHVTPAGPLYSGVM
jgi:hypothetical protein